jgi:hypothetical protein
VLFANRTQLRCRTPKFGLTLGFVSKLTTSLFRHFVPYDSLWERQNDREIGRFFVERTLVSAGPSKR